MTTTLNPEHAPTLYTGGTELHGMWAGKADLLALPVYLHTLAETYGCSDRHPRIDAAEAHLTRADEATAAVRSWTDARAGKVDEAASKYATGKITAATLAERLAEASNLQNLDPTELHKKVARVAAVLQRQARQELEGITEDEWLDLIRPAAERLLSEVEQAADSLTAERDRLAISGRTAPDAEPAAIELNVFTIRQRWERLTHALMRLYEVLGFVAHLHAHHAVPKVDGRDLHEHLWWLDLHRLEGDPNRVGEFYLHNRDRTPLGVWTTTQLRDAATEPDDAQA